MADIERTFQIPNRVPGKLVFGPRRVLATFGSIETSTPADLPPVLCPPTEATEAMGVQAGQAICGLPLCVATSKVIEVFPVVAGNNTSSDTATTSHPVDLPASIASGETLIVLFVTDSPSGGVTFPAGWTEILESNGNASIAIGYRKADGGEGASITITTVQSRASVHISYRITGASDPTVLAPETGGLASGSNSSPNPGSFTPSQGAAHLFITCYAGDGAGPETALPTNYGNDQSHATTPVHIGAGDRQAHISPENPDSFTKTGTSFWRAVTVAVFPS